MANNHSTISKAVVATVKLGLIKFEGLMLPDGNYAIAIPQLVILEIVPRNRSIKQLESNLGVTFPSHQKIKT